MAPYSTNEALKTTYYLESINNKSVVLTSCRVIRQATYIVGKF